MRPHHVALALGAMLCAGLVLIAHGSGALTGKWSVGIFALGTAICWVALELWKMGSNWPR